MTDNWKNKTKTLRCDTCFYYVNTRCRRHAPTMNGYPAVYKDDWCGDHKMDKQAIIDIEKRRDFEIEEKITTATIPIDDEFDRDSIDVCKTPYEAISALAGR